VKQDLKDIAVLCKDLVRSLIILAAQQVILRLASDEELPVCIRVTTERKESEPCTSGTD
jgi:hypothetical protein